MLDYLDSLSPLDSVLEGESIVLSPAKVNKMEHYLWINKARLVEIIYSTDIIHASTRAAR